MTLPEITAARDSESQALHSLTSYSRGDDSTRFWRQIALHLPGDLTGWRALDIGCKTGFYSLELAQRGARVTGIETDAQFLAQARAEAEQRGLAAHAEFEQKQVYDLASTWETYDLVLFLDTFHRLRYPLLGLDIAARKVRQRLIFQAPGADEDMLRSCGLRVMARPETGLFVCEPEPSNVLGANAEEFRAATALAARLTKTLHFRHCWVNSAPGYTETCYHDGTRVPAVAGDSDEYRANAAQFGYGSDLEALSRDHEILHTFLAEALGYGASPTLWAVAHGQQGAVAPIWEQEEEEGWTLAFQTFLRGGPATEPLRRLTEAGLDLETLREDAWKLLR